MFKGSNVALITPFKNNELDEETYIKLINFHLENGTNGLVPAGTTGESPTLSHSEYEKVIELCQKVRRKNQESWINNIIINTYLKLHNENKSHSVECYENNKIIGGLYGVNLGSCFFGESMFSLKNNTINLNKWILISKKEIKY